MFTLSLLSCRNKALTRSNPPSKEPELAHNRQDSVYVFDNIDSDISHAIRWANSTSSSKTPESFPTSIATFMESIQPKMRAERQMIEVQTITQTEPVVTRENDFKTAPEENPETRDTKGNQILTFRKPTRSSPLKLKSTNIIRPKFEASIKEKNSRNFLQIFKGSRSGKKINQHKNDVADISALDPHQMEIRPSDTELTDAQKIDSRLIHAEMVTKEEVTKEELTGEEMTREEETGESILREAVIEETVSRKSSNDDGNAIIDSEYNDTEISDTATLHEELLAQKSASVSVGSKIGNSLIKKSGSPQIYGKEIRQKTSMNQLERELSSPQEGPFEDRNDDKRNTDSHSQMTTGVRNGYLTSSGIHSDDFVWSIPAAANPKYSEVASRWTEISAATRNRARVYSRPQKENFNVRKVVPAKHPALEAKHNILTATSVPAPLPSRHPQRTSSMKFRKDAADAPIPAFEEGDPMFPERPKRYRPAQTLIPQDIVQEESTFRIFGKSQ